MAYFNADSGELTDDEFSRRSIESVPTGMDNDPKADEEVIKQEANDSSSERQYPEPVSGSSQPDETEPVKLAPDDLASSIAYALDGSGPGPTNDTPNVTGHKVITEGTTGAGLDEEEDNLRL